MLRLRPSRPPASPFDQHVLALIGTTIFAGFMLWLLSPILAPFLAAAILAYIFDPIVDKLEAKGVARGIGTALAVVLLLVGFALFLLIVLPLFYQEIAQLSQQIPAFTEQLKTRAMPWLKESFGIELNIDPASFRQLITDNLQDAGGLAQKVFSGVRIGGGAVLGFLINLLLIPIVLYYVLRDWDGIVARIDDLIPRRWHAKVSEMAREVDGVLSEFLRGQISVMLIMAVFYVAGLWMVGLKFALPVGLITGLLVFVPYLGSGTGLLLGTIAAVMQFPNANGVFLVWAVFTVGQLLEGFVVTPWLVGDRIGLHPVAVIFALLAFGQVFGFFGVLLGLPASAVILVGLRHLKRHYQSGGLYKG